MKKIFYGSLAVLAVSAFATPAHAQPPSHSGPPIVVPAVIFNGKAVPLPPQRIEIVPGQETVGREGKNLNGTDTMETVVTAKKMLITPRPVVSSVIRPKVVCTKVQGDGKGDWKGFYEAPKDKKVGALSDAIKGIGDKSAAKIVADGTFFKKKPRTWEDFTAEIYAAQTKLHLNIAKDVIVKFGDENMKNLGFYSAEDCKTEMVREDILEFVEDAKELEAMSRKFIVKVSGAPLVNKGEKESFTVVFDGISSRVIPSSQANTYPQNPAGRNTLDSTVFEIAGARNKVTPKVDDIQVEAKVVDGKIKYVVTNNGYDADIGGKVRVTIDTTKKGLFKKSVGSNTFELQGKSGEFDTGIAGESGSKYITQFNVSITDSPFFNDAHSARKSMTFKP